MSNKLPEDSVEAPVRSVKPAEESSGVGRTVIWMILAIIFVAEVVAMMWFAGILKGSANPKAEVKPPGSSQVQGP